MLLYNTSPNTEMLLTVLYNDKVLAEAFTVSCPTAMRRSHHLPDQLPGEQTGLQGMYSAQ